MQSINQRKMYAATNPAHNSNFKVSSFGNYFDKQEFIISNCPVTSTLPTPFSYNSSNARTSVSSRILSLPIMPFICGYLGPTIFRNQNAGETQTEKNQIIFIKQELKCRCSWKYRPQFFAA